MTLPLASGDAPALSAVLSRAFADDPYMRHVLPDDGRRAAVLPTLLGASVRYALRYGRVDVLPALHGGAVWLAPGALAVTVPRMARVGGLSVPIRIGPRGFLRMGRHDGYADGLRRQREPGPHWYLWVLGVAPTQAGCGLGSRLLRHGLARADADGLPAWLRTENERNVSTYRRHGFEVVDESSSPGGLRTWAMRRPPPLTRAASHTPTG